MKCVTTNEKGFAVLTIVGLLIVLGVASYTGFMVLEANRNSKDPRRNVPIESAIDQSESKEEDLTVKEYRNQGLGVAFTYPANWAVNNVGRAEKYTFRLVATGEVVNYDTNINQWKLKGKKEEYKVPVIKFTNNYRLYDFAALGGDGDQVCLETNLVLVSKSQVVNIYIPKACPDDKAKETDYKKSVRDKDLETFLATIKEI